jgi:hypothetical protein
MGGQNCEIGENPFVRNLMFARSIDRVAVLGNALSGFRYGDPVEGLSGLL